MLNGRRRHTGILFSPDESESGAEGTVGAIGVSGIKMNN